LQNQTISPFEGGCHNANQAKKRGLCDRITLDIPLQRAGLLHSKINTAKRLENKAQGSAQMNPGERGTKLTETLKGFYRPRFVKPFQGFGKFII